MLLWSIDSAITQIRLAHQTSQHGSTVVLGIFVLVSIILVRGLVTAYGEKACDRQITQNRLALCYLVYSLFSTIIFPGAAAVVILLLA